MLRRPFSRLSSCHRSIGSLSCRARYEQGAPASLFSRHEFYSSAPGKVPHEASGTVSSGGVSGKLFLASIVLGCGGLLAYQYGYTDHILVKKEMAPIREDIGVKYKQREEIEPVVSSTAIVDTQRVDEDEKRVSETVDSVGKGYSALEVESNIDIKTHLSEEADKDTETIPELEPKSEVDLDTTEAKISLVHEDPSSSQEILSLTTATPEITESVDYSNRLQVSDLPDETSSDTEPSQDPAAVQASADNSKGSQSLIEKYLLNEIIEVDPSSNLDEEAQAKSLQEGNQENVTRDGNLIVDLLEAIHVAEERQARLDALAFAEEKLALKEKYENELRDLRARELMRAEEVAMLDKEIKREKAKAASAIVSLHEKMEEKLRNELEQKESEAEAKLKAAQELGKAEMIAALAREKATQIEEMADTNLNISALRMAFFARSEETRQIHSVHKLALGALAVEDALAKGLPIQQEVDSLNAHMAGIDKDSLIQLVLTSLPEETRNHGTDTLLQLNRKFNGLKNSLRQSILLPPGDVGIWASALGYMASWLRLKNVDPRGNGIESIIRRVDNFLAEGKVIEAAATLQEGVKGTQAEEIIGDWVRCARNRAIAEQALTVLQSYATSVSLAH